MYFLSSLPVFRCPLYTDENIVHSTAVEAAARLIIKELKDEQPELLRNINIDKILPELKKTKVQGTHVSALDVNKVVATVIGQNVEDVNNLKDMSELKFNCEKVIMYSYYYLIIFRVIGTKAKKSKTLNYYFVRVYFNNFSSVNCV